MQQKTLAIAAGAFVTLSLAAGIVAVIWPGSGDDALTACRNTALATTSAITGDFTLVSETGEAVTRDSVVDRPTLLYFGYTFCPDICPADAARNAEVADAMAAKGFPLRPVFITIDPARDTPQALKEFTDLLHPDMLGLTGTAEQVKAAGKAFFAYAAKNGTGEDYLMDHSTFTYFMLPGRGVVDIYRHEQTAEQMIPSLSCYAEKLK